MLFGKLLRGLKSSTMGCVPIFHHSVDWKVHAIVHALRISGVNEPLGRIKIWFGSELDEPFGSGPPHSDQDVFHTYVWLVITTRLVKVRLHVPSQRCACFPEFLANVSERQILWSLCSVVFHAVTLKLPIQTSPSVATKLRWKMSKFQENKHTPMPVSVTVNVFQ